MSHKRARKKGHGRRVDRTERVLPPPEAAQHYRPWPLQLLLVEGPPHGIDADDFEAALQIVETWHALVRELDTQALLIDVERIASGGQHGMSDRDAERIACWFEWSSHLPLGLPPRLVAWIEDDEAIGSVEVLRRACRLWDRIRSERAKPPVAALDRERHHMLTMPADYCVRSQIDARPVNRPAEAIYPPPATFPRPTSSPLMGAQMRDTRWHKTRRPG